MIIIGVLFAIFGCLLLISFFISILTCRNRIEASVSKIEKRPFYLRGSSLSFYTPIFKYIIDNKTYIQKADVSTLNKNKFVLDKRIIIYVDKKNPKKMRINNNLNFLILGFVILVVGILIMYLY